MAELTKLTGTYIRSGSIPTTALSGGVVSSSLQIIGALPQNTVSSSAQVTALLPAEVVSSSTQVTSFLPAGTVSSSTQYPGWVTSSAQVDYGQLQNIPSGIASSSAQVKTYLPSDTVSSSAQVTAFLPVGTVSSSTQLPAGIASSSGQIKDYLPSDTVSSSLQVTAFLPAGTVSASGQVDFNTISNKPTLVSGSSQIDVRNTTGISTIATTGSNTFTGVQTISDTTNSTSYLDGALHVVGGMSVRQDVRVSGSVTINGLLTAVSMSTQYVTSSQYNIGVSKITLNDDDNVRFAGLSIYDSGSASPATASIYWDSLKHKFIYENISGAPYNSGMFIAGPKNTGAIGDEVGLTDHRVPVAHGDDHIDSRIESSSIRIDFPSKLTHIENGLVVTGSTTVPLTINTNDLIVSGGNVGIGTNSPTVKFHVTGTEWGSVSGNHSLLFGTQAARVQATSTNAAAGVTVASFEVHSKAARQKEFAFYDIDTSAKAASLGYFYKGGAAITDLVLANYLDGPTIFITNNVEHWRITSAGIFQSNGAQTLQTSTGNLTLATAAGNGHIILSPHGTGSVGIGTATPSYKLDVNANSANTEVAQFTGTIAGRGLKLSTYATPGPFTDAGVDFNAQHSNGQLRFSTSGSVRVLINESGNVGIGTDNPAYRLNIFTPATATRQTPSSIDRTSQSFVTITNPQYSTDASVGLLLRVFPQSDTRQGAGIVASGGASNGDTDLDIFVSSGIASSTSYSVIRLIGNTGNVGIGTTNPGSYKLQVQGNTKVVGTLETADLQLSNETYGPNSIDGTTGKWLIQEGQDDLYIINQLNGKKYKFNLVEV